MASTTKTATALWQGAGDTGHGMLDTQSGALTRVAYSAATRFGAQSGTNPEELLAAAHAGCFSMALAFMLGGAGYAPTRLQTTAAVTVEPEGHGFRIKRSALRLEAVVPGIDRAKFQEIVEGAKQGCPVSKALNAEITLDWTLG